MADPSSINYLKDVSVPIFSAFGGALVGSVAGALSTYFATSRLQERLTRWSTTDLLINEFYSDAFLAHRASIWITKKKILIGAVSLDEIAHGYWYTDHALREYFDGENIYGMTEHQHITVMMGYYIRMHNSIVLKRVDVEHLRAALASEYHWHADVLTGICIATRNAFKGKEDAIPGFVKSILAVNAVMNYPISNAIRYRKAQSIIKETDET